MKKHGFTEFKLYMGTDQKDPVTGEISEIDPERLKVFFLTTASKLKGFTLVNGLGFWEGVFEGSLILIHMGQAPDRDAVRKVGQAYKVWFNQDMVYMTENRIMAEEI